MPVGQTGWKTKEFFQVKIMPYRNTLWLLLESKQYQYSQGEKKLLMDYLPVDEGLDGFQ